MRILFMLLVLAAVSSGAVEKQFSGLTGELAGARDKFLQAKFDDALAFLDRWDQSVGKTVESLDLRGCVYIEQGKFEDAAKAFHAAHALKSDAFAPAIHHADALLFERKFDDARREYGRLAEIKSAIWPEYARFGVLLACLGQGDEEAAREAVIATRFPTESPAFYYAQAAWAFSKGKKADAEKWLAPARKIFDSGKTAWFDRALHHFGWLKRKPPPTIDPFY